MKWALWILVCFASTSATISTKKDSYNFYSSSNTDIELFDPLSSEENGSSAPPPTNKDVSQKNNRKSPQFEMDRDFIPGQFDYGGDVSSRDDAVQASIRDASLAGIHVGTIFGKRVYRTSSNGNVFVTSEFQNVQYAEAPVGSLRFQRPVLKQPLDEIEPRERPSLACPQVLLPGEVTGNEDCLHLSVFVPESHENNKTDYGFGEPPEKLPVLVWFHGENPKRIVRGWFSVLASGSAQDLQPHVFLEQKIIVVIPQYRLGSLGAATEDLNGNMGLFDQWSVLEWVQRYIGSFGGDSNQVTVMGQGSSATSLGLLALSTIPPGFFHRMILMSGSPASPLAVDSNENLTLAEVARQNSCPTFPTLQFVRCMQTKKMRSIILADEQLTKGKHFGKFRAPLPVIQKEDDGRFLPPLMFENPAHKVSKGKLPSVPVIIGVTSSEMSGFLSYISGKHSSELSTTIFSGSNVLRQFIRAILSRTKFDMEPDMLARLTTFEYFAGLNVTEREAQAKDLVEELLSDYLIYMPALKVAKNWSRTSTVYFYVFDHVPAPDSPEDNGDDATIMPGQVRRRQVSTNDSSGPPTSITQAIHGSDLQFLTQSYSGSSEDQRISQVMIDLWANFIKSGSPSKSVSEWPPYKEDTKKYLLISERVDVRSNFRSRQEQYWTELIKELGAHKHSCCTKPYQKSRT